MRIKRLIRKPSKILQRTYKITSKILEDGPKSSNFTLNCLNIGSFPHDHTFIWKIEASSILFHSASIYLEFLLIIVESLRNTSAIEQLEKTFHFSAESVFIWEISEITPIFEYDFLKILVVILIFRRQLRLKVDDFRLFSNILVNFHHSVRLYQYSERFSNYSKLCMPSMILSRHFDFVFFS